MAYQPTTWNNNESPINADNLNKIEQGIKEAHDNIDVINAKIGDLEKEIYSTEEVKTNKIWIDDKPIYRKVFNGTLPTGTGNNSFTISNSKIISVNGFVKSIYNQWWDINNYFSSNNYNINCRLSENRNEIILACGSFYDTNSEYFLIVEYTKATDEEVSNE